MHASAQGKSPRGASLPTVIMVVAMMLTLGFTVVAIAFNHLTLSFKTSNQTQADHLAEAVLAKAIGEIVENPEFGLSGTAADKTVRIVRPSSPDEMFYKLPEGSEGVLTFDEAYANDLKIPYSTNNRSEAGVSGVAGIPVPGESYHLVSTAKVKNCTSKMEAIITVPKFPFSIAAGGTIRSDGGLLVASVSPGTPYDLNYGIHPDDLRPGHVVSNGSGVGVILEGKNEIYGDLQSHSLVQLDEDTVVFGEVRPNAEKQKIETTIEVADYDRPDLDGTLTTGGTGTLAVEGYNKYVGNLTVDNGIELNGGILYVDGSLTVAGGGVSGKGAIVATQNIEINGAGEFYTDNQAALIADGDILLKGSPSFSFPPGPEPAPPPPKAKFAGLIYTNGSLHAENMRLAGVFVAAGDNSDVSFKNTEVYEDSAVLEERDDSPIALTLPNLLWESTPISVEYDVTEIQYNLQNIPNLENFRNPDQSPGQPEFLFKLPTTYPEVGYNSYKFNPDSGAVVPFFEADPAIAGDPYVLDGADLGLKIDGQTIHSLSEAASVIENAAKRIMVEKGEINEGDSLNPLQLDTVQQLAKLAFNANGPVTTISWASAKYTAEQQVPNPLENLLDFSEIFSNSKQMKVLYWGTYTE